MKTLKLRDYADPELLAIVDDVADDDGWASAVEMINEIGLENEFPQRNLGVRMGWMKKWGWIESHPLKSGTWRLTAIGNNLLLGEIDKETSHFFKKLSPSERVQVTRIISRDGSKANEALRTMMRREWQRNIRP